MLEILNQAQPEYIFSLEEYRSRDNQRDPRISFARFVAEEAEQVVGTAQYDQRMDMYHPGKFILHFAVRPREGQERIASALYETLMNTLETYPISALRAFANERYPWQIAFWKERGFIEGMRDGSAILDLNTFDFSRFPDIDGVVRLQGITIRTIKELEVDPERNIRLCALQNALLADVPPAGERTPMDLDTFLRVRLGRPDVLPDGHFVALAPDGQYIGTATINQHASRDSQVLATGLTGVLPEWRRRGIAIALKFCGIRFAREKGAVRLTTYNASHNEPILALNARLGFVREPWRLHLVKTFGEDNA